MPDLIGYLFSVSYMAHIGGAASGIFMGILILRNLKTLDWEKIVWWITLVLFIGGVITLIGLNVGLEPGKFYQPPVCINKART